MRSRTSRGVPEWSGGEELYIGSDVSAIGKVSGAPGIVLGPPEVSQGVHRVGPPIPEGPMGQIGKGNQPIVGWCALLGPPPAPRVGNPRVGGAALALGATPPLAAAPLGDPIS